MLILYTTDDGKSQIQLRAENDTVWLSQREMAELFDVSTDNIGLHLKNLYEDEELSREATTEDSSVVQTEGSREVRRPLTLYNLDAILAVGYRVRSPRGVQFRRWASTVLKEYLIKGFVTKWGQAKLFDILMPSHMGISKPPPHCVTVSGVSPAVQAFAFRDRPLSSRRPRKTRIRS